MNAVDKNSPIPAHILRDLFKSMKRERKVLVYSVYVPDRYDVYLSEEDFGHLRPLIPTIREQVTQELEKRIKRHDYRLLTEHIHLEFKVGNEQANKKAAVKIDAQYGRQNRVEAPTRMHRVDHQIELVSVTQTKIPTDHQEEASGRVIELITSNPEDKPCEAASMHCSCLLEHSKNGRRRRLWLGETSLQLGRGAVDLVAPIDDLTVSREHACVRPLGTGDYEIVDLHSSNGLCINGNLYESKLLEDGDIIDLGSWRLEYIAEAKHAVAPGD